MRHLLGVVEFNLMSTQKRELTVDLVIPVFNEAGVVEQTYSKICESIHSLSHNFHIFFVDDGSTDATAESLLALARAEKNITVLTLARNFGHQAALSAGLDASRGDFVISMDADGQHPPELIPQMIEQFTSGAADFRGMSRQAVDALKSMPEYHRFLRGMIAWMGYRSVILPYHEVKRVAGTSKYSLGKMFRLAMDAIFSFSLMPLYIGLSAGGLFFCLAALEMIYVLSFWVTGRTSSLAPGWSSLMFVILIVSGMLMILLGFIGVYVGYIFQEVKHRPVYLLKKRDQ